MRGFTSATRLDPKYFQSHPANMTDSVSSKLLKQTGVRISKPLVQTGSINSSQPQQHVTSNQLGTGSTTSGSTSSSSSSSTTSNISSNANCLSSNGALPSLASAYFPSS